MNIFLLSCSWHERIIYRASAVQLVLCGHGKGRRDLSEQQNILCKQPLVTAARPVARRGSCDGATVRVTQLSIIPVMIDATFRVKVLCQCQC